MAFLKTGRYPAAAPGGYEWPDGATVVDVHPELATELLRIQGAQFSEVLPGDPDYPEPEPVPAKVDLRRRTPVTE